jgi:hypothetical protein
MSNKLNISEIRDFWQWFSANCEKIAIDFENSNLLDELDNRITSLGDFTWEIGPGKIKSCALVISPGGDVELLKKTKEVVKNALECKDWEYYYAKPPKEWDLTFDYETQNGKTILVDASGWEYVLLKYEDGMFEIIIKDFTLCQLDDDEKQIVAEIVLDGVLGEELRMERIFAIEIVDDFAPQYQDKSTNIKKLESHLKSLMS